MVWLSQKITAKRRQVSPASLFQEFSSFCQVTLFENLIILYSVLLYDIIICIYTIFCTPVYPGCRQVNKANRQALYDTSRITAPLVHFGALAPSGGVIQPGSSWMDWMGRYTLCILPYVIESISK